MNNDVIDLATEKARREGKLIIEGDKISGRRRELLYSIAKRTESVNRLMFQIRIINMGGL